MSSSTSTSPKFSLISWLTQRQDRLIFILPIVLVLPFYFLNRSLLGSGFYILGWYLGFLLMILDKKKLYTYYFKYIQEPNENYAKLLTRNFLFILTLIPLSIFILTSSGSYVGVGFIGAILLSLSLEMWAYYLFPQNFIKYFIQSSDKEWSAQEIKYLTYGFTGFTVFVILLSIF